MLLELVDVSLLSEDFQSKELSHRLKGLLKEDEDEIANKAWHKRCVQDKIDHHRYSYIRHVVS
jgi:hypothetical protein